LNDLGLANEVRLTRAMGSLATNTDLYASALDTANSAWMENTAMVNEAEKRYATLKSALSQTWEAIKQAGNELGQALTPSLKNILGVVKDVALWFSKLDDSTQQTIAKMLLWGAAISPITKMISGLTGGLAGLVRTFTGVNNVAGFFAEKMGLAYESTMLSNFGSIQLQGALGDLAAEEGVATTSVTGFTKALVAAHPVAVGMTGIVAGLTLMWIDNARHLKELKKETQEYLSENSEAYNSVKQATMAFEQYSEAYKGHKEAIQGIKDGYETNAVAADQYVKTISRLNGMEHLSLSQKTELKTALEGLKTIFPELGYTIDETTGKVIDETGAVLENTDALKENIEAYKQAAKEKAYIDSLSQYSQAIAESELQVKKLSSRYGELIQETNEAEKAYQKALEAYGQDKSNENWKALEDAQAKFQELANATGTAGIQIAEANKNIRDSVQGMMETVGAEKGIEGLKSEFESMATVAKDSGYEITASFAQSIRDGSVDMNEAIDFLSSLMSFQEIVDEAGEYGGLIDSGLADSMINNAPSIQEATTNLNNLIDFTNAVETSGLKGSELVNRLVANIQSGHMSVQDATNLLMSGSISEIEHAVNDMEAEAARAPIGVARALGSGDTSSAGSALIGGAKSSVIGGLRDMENAASSTANAISGILSGINMAIAAAAQKASSISVSANKGRSFDDYTPYMDRASDLYYARDLGNAVDTSSISYVGASTIVPNGGTIGGYTSYASATVNNTKIDQLINALNGARLVINLAPAQVNGRTLYEAVTEETTIADLLNGYGKGLANV
jgi:tetratricopeptide (TPR) repeat protein